MYIAAKLRKSNVLSLRRTLPCLRRSGSPLTNSQFKLRLRGLISRNLEMHVDLRAHGVSEYDWEAIIKLICRQLRIPRGLCQNLSEALNTSLTSPRLLVELTADNVFRTASRMPSLYGSMIACYDSSSDHIKTGIVAIWARLAYDEDITHKLFENGSQMNAYHVLNVT
jgi:hypothetical protein